MSTKELVLPSQEEMDAKVIEKLKIEDKVVKGTVVGENVLLHKVEADKIFKQYGVPLEVVRQYDELKDMMTNSVASHMGTRLSGAVVEAKKKGASIDDLKDMEIHGKITLGSGSIRLKVDSHAEHRNMQTGAVIDAVGFTSMRVTTSHDMRWMQSTEASKEMRNALGIKSA